MQFSYDKSLPKTSRNIVVAGVILAVLSAILIITKVEPLAQLDRYSYDLMLRGLGAKDAHPEILIVDIGEDSLNEFGQWPWPRNLIARLLGIVNQGEPEFVGVDILFPEPDRTSLGNYFDELEDRFGTTLNKEDYPPEDIDHDRALAAVLKNGEFYLGASLRFGVEDAEPESLTGTGFELTLTTSHGGDKITFITADDIVTPIKKLADASKGIGFINVLPEKDGIIRKTPLVLQYNDKIYPSLGLSAYLRHVESRDLTIKSTSNGDFELIIQDEKVPVDQYANMVIRFRGGSHTYPYIPAEMVLNGEIAPEIFRDKIVFVGSTAEGLQDTHVTAFDRDYSGVEVQATVAGALLEKDFIVKPGWSTGIQGACLFFVILIALLAELRFSAWAAGMLFMGLLALLPIATFLLFYISQIFISPTSSLVLFVISFALLALIRFRSDEIRTHHYERQLAAAQEMAIVGLASIVETRDNETGRHILRTQKYVKLLAKYLSKKYPDKYHFEPEEIDLLYKSSALHDVGKVGVPDNILLKEGPLTDEEFNEMKKHTLYGAKALEKADDVAREAHEPPFLEMAREICLSHHERWDGTGYPYGLKGEQIPVVGRLMALADVYDALVTKRVYKDALSHKDASQYILTGRSRHFDPLVADAFEVLLDEFHEIAENYRDS